MSVAAGVVGAANLRLDDPGRTLAGLAPLEIASPNHAKCRHLGDANDLCSRIERNFAAVGPFAVAVYRDVVVVAEATHALLGPPVAITSQLARTIEQTGDLSIRHQTCQLAYERNRIIRRRPMVPAGSIQSQLDL